MNQSLEEQTVDGLREKYLNMAPYPMARLFDRGLFTPEEIKILEKYGYWFEALLLEQVPITTEKQKKFMKAQKKGFEPKGIYERLWYRYRDATKTPF